MGLKGICVRCGDSPISMMQCRRCQIHFCGICFSPEVLMNEHEQIEKKNRCPGCHNESLLYFHHSWLVQEN